MGGGEVSKTTSAMKIKESLEIKAQQKQRSFENVDTKIVTC
jgi:hypothetical protein